MANSDDVATNTTETGSPLTYLGVGSASSSSPFQTVGSYGHLPQQVLRPRRSSGAAGLVAVASSTQGSNSERARFFDLLETLDELGKLDEEDDLFVSSQVAERAKRALSNLEQAYSFNWPKLLPEGADSLSLTWMKGPLKVFVSIYADETRLMFFNKKSNISCDMVIGEGPDLGLQRLADYLAFIPKNFATSSDVDVAR